MMSQPTGIKILKKYGLTTGRVEKNQSASRRPQKSSVRGEKKISGERVLIALYHEHFVLGSWYGDPVVDAVKRSQLPITRTMTNLWKLCGFASRATSNAIKN